VAVAKGGAIPAVLVALGLVVCFGLAELECPREACEDAVLTRSAVLLLFTIPLGYLLGCGGVLLAVSVALQGTGLANRAIVSLFIACAALPALPFLVLRYIPPYNAALVQMGFAFLLALAAVGPMLAGAVAMLIAVPTGLRRLDATEPFEIR